ncbi:hypothetical protein ACTQ5R_09005 [Ruoffia tabacinasalis]|uniref:hypothetical protein n=1 Tax=Ruoffia tabacinasalis TaxID=87458 RepID=UPI003F9D0FFD
MTAHRCSFDIDKKGSVAKFENQTPIDYTQTRIIRTSYLSNAQLRSAISKYRSAIHTGEGLAILIAALNGYLGTAYGITTWLANGHLISLQNAADTGRGVRIVTHEKVNWDGYSPRIYNVLYLN